MRAVRLALLLSLAACSLAACDAQPLDSHGGFDAGVEPPDPTPDAGDPTDAGTPPDAGDAGTAPVLGATVTPAGVAFRVWAPHATAARVLGDFTEQSVVMSAEPGGLFAATVASAHAGTRYTFALDTPSGPVTRLDPYCREVLADGSACTVIDPSAYAWKSAPFARPARNATVVYEMHVGSFAVAPGAASGTFADAQAGLADLADLGVDVVELMPVQAFGGKPNGWGYNPQLFFAPKPSYGGADALRAFVDEAHARGIGVWMDTVINHYDGWSKAPLACFDGACAGGSHGIYFFPPGQFASTPWGPRPDYTEPEVAAMLQATVPFWLGEQRGDGFRWDSVSNIRAIDGSGTTPGGKEILLAVNELTHAAGGTSVAEDLKGYDGITKSANEGGLGFDAQWDGFGYAVDGVLVPYADDGRDLGVIQGALQGGYGGDPFARVLFTEDHDTVGNGGTRLPSAVDPAMPTSFSARRRSMLGAALLLTTPGVPMLFMGQESLALGTFANPPGALADSLPPEGAKVRAFYKDMIALRRNLGGKSGGLLDVGVDILHRNDAAKVIAYRRHGDSGEDVIVVLNLRKKAYQEYDVGVPADGSWRIRLDTDWQAYGADFGGGQQGSVATLPKQKDGHPYTLPVKLGEYAAVVFSR
jgi:1,4-alpha-glucan branching enzyme